MSLTATSPKLKETNLPGSQLYARLLSFLLSHKRVLAFEVADRKFLLYIVDLLLVLLATYTYCSSVNPALAFTEDFTPYLPWFLSVSVLWTFFSYMFELYNLEFANKFYVTFKAVLIACSLTVLAYVFLPWVTPGLPTSRLSVILYYFNALSSVLIWRYLYSRLLDRPLFLKRVVIVGSGWPCNALINVFADGDIFNFHLGYKVVGIVDSEAKEGSYKGVRIIRNAENLPKLVKRLKVDEIIVNESCTSSNKVQSLQNLTKCRMKGTDVVALSDFYESLTGRVLVHNAERDFYLAFPYNKFHYRKAYHVFSRLLDILFGLVGLALCLFLAPLVYLANLLGNQGPLLYKQERVGLYGKTFIMTKFRSMVINAEEDGAAWAQVNDCRITPFGRLLRRSRIDELPQAWSVLKGEMSLIGPRPERPCFVEQLRQEIPFYDTRHLAKPGITGWAQAIYKYGSNTEDALMKMQYDLYYLKNRSFMLDIKVLLKTVSVVLRFKGV